LTLFLAVSSGGLGLLSGCRQDTGGRVAVSGSVKFRGTPLKSGVIEFMSKDLASQSGATIADGKYAIPAPKGLRPGEYTVRISSVQEQGPAPAGPPGPEAAAVKAVETIPAEYNAKSALTATIPQGGSDKVDFDLK
jgi:hypothetical protein